MFLRILGRWLLYTLLGALYLVMLLGASGDAVGSDQPKGSWRSIFLAMGAVVPGLGGASVWFAHSNGGPWGAYWPGAAIAAWFVTGGLVIAAWISIGHDLVTRAPERR